MSTKQQGSDKLPEEEKQTSKQQQQGDSVKTAQKSKEFDIHHGIKTLYG